MAIKVRHLLHKHLAGMVDERSHKIVHASDLTKPKEEDEFCPREYALMDTLKIERPMRFMPTGLHVTFNYGHTLQSDINNNYLRDKMWGSWECASCGKEQGISPLPAKKTCAIGVGANGATIKCNWNYREVRAIDPLTQASCGIDGLIEDGPKLRMVEIKTEVKDEFKKLLAPRAEHRVRSKVYMYIVARDPELKDLIHTDHLNLLYVCKGYGVKDDKLHKALKKEHISDWPFTPFKEWRIHRDDTEIKPYMIRAAVVQKFRNSGEMPQGVCPTAMCKRAKNCNVRQACFSGKYPVELKWRKK